MSLEAPTALRRFGDENPGALGQLRVAGGGRHDVGQLSDHAELLVAIEHTDGGEDLDADVVAVTGNVRYRISRQVVDERGGVVLEQRNVGDLLPPHHGGGKVLCQCMLLAES